jgi:HemX protein
MMVTLFFASALLLYVAASGTLAASFAGGRETAPRTGTALVTGGVLLHGVGLGAFTARYAELPLVGLAPSLCTLAFLIALFLFVSTVTRESRTVGLVLVPLVAVLLAIALLLGVTPGAGGQPLAVRGVWWFRFHIVLAFVGYAGLSISFAAGLLYLLQFRELKGKRLGRVFRFFPSLPALDRLGQRGLAVGFPALTLALVIAWAWTVRFQRTVAAADPQVIWGVLTWLTFAVVLLARGRGGTDNERRGARASVIGFVVVVVAYVVLRVSMAVGGVFL